MQFPQRFFNMAYLRTENDNICFKLHYNRTSSCKDMGNSTYCCKETPSTIGWNHILPALYWNQQSCFFCQYAHFSPKRMLCETRAFIAKRLDVRCANWIALSVDGIYCMTELFLKTTFEWIVLISSSRWWHFVTATSAILTFQTKQQKKKNTFSKYISKSIQETSDLIPLICHMHSNHLPLPLLWCNIWPIYFALEDNVSW